MSGGRVRRIGDTGTCTVACNLDLSNRSSCRPAILDCARLAATEFDRASCAEPVRTLSFSVSEVCFDFFCNFFNLSRAWISCNFNCSVSSSSSSKSSISSSKSSWALFCNDGVDLERLMGEGEGEARSARRRRRSLPPGVLKRTSWGDLGGH